MRELPVTEVYVASLTKETALPGCRVAHSGRLRTRSSGCDSIANAVKSRIEASSRVRKTYLDRICNLKTACLSAIFFSVGIQSSCFRVFVGLWDLRLGVRVLMTQSVLQDARLGLPPKGLLLKNGIWCGSPGSTKNIHRGALGNSVRRFCSSQYRIQRTCIET